MGLHGARAAHEQCFLILQVQHKPGGKWFFVVEVFFGFAYLGKWDTLPQRRALIWKDSIHGYTTTGIAAG